MEALEKGSYTINKKAATRPRTAYVKKAVQQLQLLPMFNVLLSGVPCNFRYCPSNQLLGTVVSSYVTAIGGLNTTGFSVIAGQDFATLANGLRSLGVD